MGHLKKGRVAWAHGEILTYNKGERTAQLCCLQLLHKRDGSSERLIFRVIPWNRHWQERNEASDLVKSLVENTLELIFLSPGSDRQQAPRDFVMESTSEHSWKATKRKDHGEHEGLISKKKKRADFKTSLHKGAFKDKWIKLLSQRRNPVDTTWTRSN